MTKPPTCAPRSNIGKKLIPAMKTADKTTRRLSALRWGMSMGDVCCQVMQMKTIQAPRRPQRAPEAPTERESGATTQLAIVP
mmetsp:Transcript_30782/g.71919  ORF Transcript_30782/g.71919 Transcript_30782/m.71919 type:complete len:82 (-) Transcript_30782:1040-1285(-)